MGKAEKKSRLAMATKRREGITWKIPAERSCTCDFFYGESKLLLSKKSKGYWGPNNLEMEILQIVVHSSGSQNVVAYKGSEQSFNKETYLTGFDPNLFDKKPCISM